MSRSPAGWQDGVWSTGNHHNQFGRSFLKCYKNHYLLGTRAGGCGQRRALPWFPRRVPGVLSRSDGVDPAIRVEGQFVNAYRAAEGVSVREFARVIEDIPFTLELDDGAVLRDARGVLHHLSGIGERAHRVIANGINCVADGAQPLEYTK